MDTFQRIQIMKSSTTTNQSTTFNLGHFEDTMKTVCSGPLKDTYVSNQNRLRQRLSSDYEEEPRDEIVRAKMMSSEFKRQHEKSIDQVISR